jgi:hypothetical protein
MKVSFYPNFTYSGIAFWLGGTLLLKREIKNQFLIL